MLEITKKKLYFCKLNNFFKKNNILFFWWLSKPKKIIFDTIEALYLKLHLSKAKFFWYKKSIIQYFFFFNKMPLSKIKGNYIFSFFSCPTLNYTFLNNLYIILQKSTLDLYSFMNILLLNQKLILNIHRLNYLQKNFNLYFFSIAKNNLNKNKIEFMLYFIFICYLKKWKYNFYTVFNQKIPNFTKI